MGNKSYQPQIKELVKNIENHDEVVNATKVLQILESKGLRQPAIASGWIRGWLTGTEPSDIDIAYVGDVHYDDAQKYLVEALDQLGIDKSNWDISGIWNAEMDDPRLTSTRMHYEIHYVCSIDSVYLASDGHLHDTFGSGVGDAINKVLRLNDFIQIAQKYGFSQPDRQIVYYATEGLRRIYRFGWDPTPRSIELMNYGLEIWARLPDEFRQKTISRLRKKYKPLEYTDAQILYSKYGWGFLFDMI